MNQNMGSNTPTFLLVQLDMEISQELEMMRYGFYHCKWYIIHFEDGTLASIY